MKWNKITSSNNLFLYWECIFANAPFLVRVFDDAEGVKARLFFTIGNQLNPITSKIYSSIDVAQNEVESFVLDHLAQYSAIVHRECLEANVMTWRKLKEQLDQIPDEQLDSPIDHLDTDGYWVGEPRIELAEQNQYMHKEDCRDVTNSSVIVEDQELVVEKGKYFLSTCNV